MVKVLSFLSSPPPFILSHILSLSLTRSFFLKVIGSIEKSKSTEEEPSFFLQLVPSFHPCKVQTSSLVKFHSGREVKQQRLSIELKRLLFPSSSQVVCLLSQAGQLLTKAVVKSQHQVGLLLLKQFLDQRCSNIKDMHIVITSYIHRLIGQE